LVEAGAATIGSDPFVTGEATGPAVSLASVMATKAWRGRTVEKLEVKGV
jgi:hypothetical protein